MHQKSVGAETHQSAKGQIPKALWKKRLSAGHGRKNVRRKVLTDVGSSDIIATIILERKELSFMMMNTRIVYDRRSFAPSLPLWA